MYKKNDFSVVGTAVLQPHETQEHEARIISFSDIDQRTELERMQDMYARLASDRKRSFRKRCISFVQYKLLDIQTVRAFISPDAKAAEEESKLMISSRSSKVALACIFLAFCTALIAL